MTDNQIAKHFQSFCKELVEWIDSPTTVSKPEKLELYCGICANFNSYIQAKNSRCSSAWVWDWMEHLFVSNQMDIGRPFNYSMKDYRNESNKFTNPDRIAFIRKYANEFPEIN